MSLAAGCVKLISFDKPSRKRKITQIQLCLPLVIFSHLFFLEIDMNASEITGRFMAPVSQSQHPAETATDQSDTLQLSAHKGKQFYC